MAALRDASIEEQGRACLGSTQRDKERGSDKFWLLGLKSTSSLFAWCKQYRTYGILDSVLFVAFSSLSVWKERGFLFYSSVFQNAVAGNIHTKVNPLEMEMNNNRQAQGHHQIFTGIHPVSYFMSQRILCPCLQCTHIIPTHAVQEGCNTFLWIFKLASNFQILWEAGPLMPFG